MFYDYFLKFADEAEATAALFDAEGRASYLAIDVIGPITRDTGTVDASGQPVMQTLTGWHVNVRHNAEAPELAAWAVQPAQPARVFA